MNIPNPAWESGLRVTISDDEGALFAVHQFFDREEIAALLMMLKNYADPPDWAQKMDVSDDTMAAVSDLLSNFPAAADAAGKAAQ